MMKKLIILVLLLFVIFSLNVSARRVENFSASDAYDWLLSQGKKGSYNDDIVDTSAAFLALSAAGGSGTLEKEYLISQENELKCWPKSSCKTKDTALSILSLYKSGDTSYVNDAAAWLKAAQKSTLTGGNWWLEIDTPDTGTCTIKYTKKDKEFTKDIKVEAGKFPDCGKGTFFDLKSCIETGLLTAFASLELNVDCSSLSSAKISIAYNSGSNYYLYQEVSETTAKIIVKNGCFSVGFKEDSCNYESSLYTEWVLSQIGSTLSSELYLRENYDQNNILHNSLLYITTKNKAYADQILKLQKSDGSWDSNTLSTAFAILALSADGGTSSQVTKAQEWLMIKQNEDGSWDDKVFNTAMVLYSSFYQGVDLPSCTDGVKNQGERGIDCGGPCELGEYEDDCCDNSVRDEEEDGIDCGGICGPCQGVVCDEDESCDSDIGEDCDNCPDDCLSCGVLCGDGQMSPASNEEGVDCGGYCDTECIDVCNYNEECETDLIDQGHSNNENSQNCPEDCFCGDKICDDYESVSGECPEDCPITGEGECGDGICDEGEDVECPEDCVSDCNNDDTCDEDESCDCGDCAGEDRCAEEGGKLKWIIILFIVIALGGGAYFFLTRKKGGGKAEGPSYDLYGRGLGPARTPPEKPKAKGSFFSEMAKPKQQPPAQQRQFPSRGGEGGSKLDEELEKSLKEAKKLIKEEK